MITLGVICEVKSDRSLVRVNYQGTITDFIPYLATANSFKKHFLPPRVGEQVLLLGTDKGNAKFALRGIFSHETKEPKGNSQNKEIHEYEDGTTISYDTKNSTLEIKSPKVINLVATTNISVTTPTLNLNGNLKVSGNISDARGDLTGHSHKDSDGATSLPR